jgi:DGQHR domain-containing protein
VQTITLPAIEIVQDGSRLLLTKMRAGDLVEFTKVDPYVSTKAFDDPDQGYQRPAELPRIKKFANWLKHEVEEGNTVSMPTSILLSARGSDVALSPNGTITLKSSNKLPLVDGQHRQRGFLYLIEDKGMKQFANYEIPVVIMMSLDKVGEMRQFNTVNGTQKSVRLDLVNMILTQLTQQEGDTAVKSSDLWRVVVSQATKHLNDETSGPWFDRIVMPDMRTYTKEETEADPELRHRRVVRATSFMTAIKPIESLVADHYKSGTAAQREDNLYHVLDGFWRALRRLNPICFNKADDYVMLKTPGIFALHKLCFWVMKDMRVGKRDWTEDQFQEMLKDSSWLTDPSKWFVGSDVQDRGEAAHFGSMKGFAELADLLYEDLRP